VVWQLDLVQEIEEDQNCGVQLDLVQEIEEDKNKFYDAFFIFS
jgi:hypothetical protein